VRTSYLAAIAEHQLEGRYTDLDVSHLTAPTAFAAHIETLLAKALPQPARPEGIVPETVLWWVDGQEYLGRISIRHRLTEPLRRVGGHIGYDVRPTARRRGHATAMLRAALPVAARLGIASALVTCDVDNAASRRVIEANACVPDTPYEDKLRFWLPTTDRS
jgi:predicted acetyltransferase